MRRAWVVLLASCGFKGPIANQVDPDAGPDASTDASADASPDTDPRASCWSHPTDFTACTADILDRIDVIVNVSLNTDTGISDPIGITCTPVDNPGICALAARTFHINGGVTLSAHGTRPLAILGHSIDIQGTIDVASHLYGFRGPAARPQGCSGRIEAALAGGGAGGTYTADGGEGGEQGGATGTAGRPASSISTTVLRGGCDGGRGGNGLPDGVGGAGGGGVWIAIDAGTLVIGPAATINASGAGGLGGAAGARGGSGGGSGGMIVLQAPNIVYDASARIFANGGHGGGGSQGGTSGADGTDPTGPTSGGGGGSGGLPLAATPPRSGVPLAATPPGGGAAGFPDPERNGAPGQNEIPFGGGGGGGGGPGIILVYSSATIAGPNISPQPSP